MISEFTILSVQYEGARLQLIEVSDHYGENYYLRHYCIRLNRRVVRNHIATKAAGIWLIIEILQKEFCRV